MSPFTATDHLFMARALRLAERAAYTTKPNPMVGCVISLGEEIVGEGFHQRAGEAHAEVIALQAAGGRAKSALNKERRVYNRRIRFRAKRLANKWRCRA